MKQKSKVRENGKYEKVLVFQRFFLLERLPLMDARAAINGIQEVSGSIPLISTKRSEIVRFRNVFLYQENHQLGWWFQKALAMPRIKYPSKARKRY